MAKIFFFGTHNFAATILQGLIDSPNFAIEAVVTQPDKPAGRHQKALKSPVKTLAEEHGLKILQPNFLDDVNVQHLISNIDLFVVAQYGILIPKNILYLPKHGSINVHASLLPKYRGASPIQCALIDGEEKTGVTIMLVDEKMDHGPILTQKEITIDKDDTYLSLSQKAAATGRELLLQTVPKWIVGEIKPQPQDQSQATYAKILTRDDGRVDFAKSAREIYNLWRGLTPWPGVWTTWQGKRLKLLSLKPADKQLSLGLARAEKGEIFIGCADGAIQVLELHLEGKKATDATQFLNGCKNFNGAKLE